MARVVSFEGRKIEVPDDATDDEVASILGEGQPAPPPQAGPSVAADMAGGLGAGVVRGAAEMAMLPVTAKRLIETGMGWAVDKGDQMGRAIFGRAPRTPEAQASLDQIGKGGLANDAQDWARSQMNEQLYAPKTRAGKVMQTVGEFAVPGGLPSRAIAAAPTIGRAAAAYAGRVGGDVVLPALASEAGGELLKGSGNETAGRVAGALAGNAATMGVRAYGRAPESVIRQSIPDTVTPQQFDEAAALQARSNQPGAVPLTGSEALDQVTNKGTGLGDMMRVVEGAPQGQLVTAPFFAQRPGQVRDATGNVLDTIAPQSPVPSTLGPRVAEVAAERIDGVRQGINRATEPAYAAASGHRLDPADFAPIAQDSAFQASLRRLRADEVLGPRYAGMPDDSVGVINAVTKDMRDRGVALGNSANPGFSSETAGLYSSGATEARDIARNPARGGVQAYDDALTAQEQARRQNLNPLEQGPLGNVARATDTDGAFAALLPNNPHVGGGAETATAVGHLVAGDAPATAALVRQGLANRFAKADETLVGGENQYAGAKFAKEVAGRTQQEQNLIDTVMATSGPQAAQEVENLVEIFRATGTRKPQGSGTSFNDIRRDTMGQGSLRSQLTHLASTGGTSWLTQAKDRYNRFWLGANTDRLARINTAPDAVEQMRVAVQEGAPAQGGDALLRAIFQTPVAAQRAREERR